MIKYILTVILLAGFLTSCTSNRSLVDYCPAYSQIDTTQADSVLFVVR